MKMSGIWKYGEFFHFHVITSRVSVVGYSMQIKNRVMKRTNPKDNKDSPPVGISVNINFLASLTVRGVTGTRRLGCQTLILLEKLMKLKRSPGRKSLRMVNRASLVCESHCEKEG